MNENKKTIITNISQKIFSRYGLIKTTVNEIAKAARMGKATLYHYFKGKEDIYREVVEKESKVLTQKIREAINKEDKPKEKLRAYIMTRMKYLNELANIHSALTDEYLDHYAFIEKIRKNNFQQEIKTIQSMLADGNNNKIFSIEDTELTAFAIISALKGLEYPWSTEIPLSKIQNNTDKLIDILFNGIVKR